MIQPRRELDRFLKSLDYFFKDLQVQSSSIGNEDHTLLTSSSVTSKCLPTILGASPGMGSIFRQTSMPFVALSTCLWLTSRLLTRPTSMNWKNNDAQELVGRGTIAVHRTNDQDADLYLSNLHYLRLLNIIYS